MDRPMRLASWTLKGILLEHFKTILTVVKNTVLTTMENSDPLWEFVASDDEDSEVIKPISSTSSGFTGTIPNTTKWFFNTIVTVTIL